MCQRGFFPGFFLLRAVFLSALMVIVAACAGDGPEPRPTDCADCGRVIAITPVSGSARPTRSAAERAAGSSRVLTPSPALGAEVSRMTGDLRLMGVGGDAVPVYRLRDGGTLSPRSEVTLEMDRGGVERLLVEDAQFLAVGDRVRRVGNRLMPETDTGAFAQ